MAYPTTANNLLTAATDGTSTVDAAYDHGLNHNNANTDTNALTQRLGTGADTTPGGTNKVFTSTGATSSAWSGNPTVTSVTTVGAATVGNALTVQAGGAAITGAVGITGAETVTSSSSAALTVGPTGSTNPALQVDGSTASQVNGLKITGSATGQPSLIATVGTDTDISLRLAPKGAGGVRVLSTAADAFDVGPNGATNPVLKVDGSVVSQADGISIQGGAAGAGTIISAISGGSDSSIVLTPKGSGGVQQTIGSLSLAQNPAAGAATSIASSGTIASSTSIQRITLAADVTGVIVSVGTVAGQQLEILNTSTHQLTMAAVGTSNVSGGTSNVIAGGSGLTLVWSSVEALWFPTGGGGGGGGSTTQVDQFLSQSGTTVTLTATVGNVLGVYVNGIAQRKTTDWTIAGQVVTFVSTLASDDVIVVYTTSTSGLTGTVSVVEQEFANASGTTVTLSQTNISGVALVARNGVIQRQGVDYTINATTGVITFTTTLSSEQVSAAYWTGGAGTGNATTLNGFTTSASKANNAIPLTDSSGHIPTGTSFGLRTRTIILNGTTSYTYPVNTQAIKVHALAGGGGGGGCAASAAGTAAASGGGGGGSYSESFITSLPASPVTVAVGAGGGGGAAGANTGTTGGNTTFNVSTVTTTGGNGGGGSSATGGTGAATGPALRAAAGTGDIALTGSFGGEPLQFASGVYAISGIGGNGVGPYGGAGGVSNSADPSVAAAGALFGAGGSGGSTYNGGTSTAGGNGANGLLVIEEYY